LVFLLLSSHRWFKAYSEKRLLEPGLLLSYYALGLKGLVSVYMNQLDPALKKGFSQKS
jgi:hypothetical protein